MLLCPEFLDFLFFSLFLKFFPKTADFHKYYITFPKSSYLLHLFALYYTKNRKLVFFFAG